MSERIAFASWDFIELVCSAHNEILNLEIRKQQPMYVCPAKGCHTHLPATVYEKILSDIVERLNVNGLAVGEVWRKKYQGKSYEFRVIILTTGKKTQISVRNLGG